MTVLTIRPLRIRAATGLLKPGQLASLLEMTQRMIKEAAACQAGELRAMEGQDPLVVWASRGRGEPPALRACRVAWDLARRCARKQVVAARQHGVVFCPGIGIAADDRYDDRGQGAGRTLERARLLQRANRLYGTTILVDAAVATAASRRMAFREVDRPGAGGHGLLRSREAFSRLRVTAEELASMDPHAGAIHELLGPRGTVPAARQSAAVAFQGALELYAAGQWSQAATLFHLLASGPCPDALAGLYLQKCRQHVREDEQVGALLAPGGAGGAATAPARPAAGRNTIPTRSRRSR
jgi:hypothetical protein